MVDLNDHRRIVLISSWVNKSAREAWLNSDKRKHLEARLNDNLKQPPMIRTFMLGVDYLGGVFEEVIHDSEIKS